ncbi:MAG: hypothetical protein EOO71_39580 [Myxococcaceae bacterium]|nr:MAG: hypothetical protein EOO71_39580 [Myxococcaceae bacterium]
MRGYYAALKENKLDVREIIRDEMAMRSPEERQKLIGIHRLRVAERQATLKEHVELVAALREQTNRFPVESFKEALSHLKDQEWPATDYLDEKLIFEAMVEDDRALSRARK